MIHQRKSQELSTPQQKLQQFWRSRTEATAHMWRSILEFLPKENPVH